MRYSHVLVICVTFTVFAFSSVFPQDNQIFIPEPEICPTDNNESPLDLDWLVERYDLDWIEQHFDQYYGEYYKPCEDFINNKPREIAGKFGLSNIFVDPNFQRYEDTKLVLSRSFWDKKFVFKYYAPVGDLTKFSLSVSIKPYDSVSFIAKGDIDGDFSIAILANRPLGRLKKEPEELRRIKQYLNNAKGVLY
ncbi:hypothetical protein GF312_09335 [Candidatus Poribacteria bacterium]|nr:hypothetical protein [Candidatus Poribacteria bacterium]